MALKIVYSVLLVLGTAQCSVLPVEKCTLTDKSCMKSAFQKMIPVFMVGMPDLGVEVLDVMKVDHLKFDITGLQFSLTEGTIKGLKNTVVDDVDWDLDKKKFIVKFHLDTLVKGHYTAGGRLLILPVNGDGQMKMKLKNVQVKLSFYYDVVKAGDKDHIKFIKYENEFEVKDNAHFDFTNLFNGNRQLSDTVLTFVNDNWKQITMEFGKPLVNAAMEKLSKNIGTFFEKLPLQDIANI